MTGVVTVDVEGVEFCVFAGVMSRRICYVKYRLGMENKEVYYDEERSGYRKYGML